MERVNTKDLLRQRGSDLYPLYPQAATTPVSE